MREFVIPVAVGVAIGFAWLAIWFVVLRAFGVPVLMRTSEEQASRKQYILRLGKLRYILIFGVLGAGFGYGLGISTALMMLHGYDWGLCAMIFGTVALISGCMNGLSSWKAMFRSEAPFPPHYPPTN